MTAPQLSLDKKGGSKISRAIYSLVNGRSFYLIGAFFLPLCIMWIIFMINVLPSKPCFLSYVGANTMPVYMFHLALRYVIQFYGSYIAFIGCLIVAWLGIISLIYKKGSISKAVYVFLELASIAGFIALFASGVLQPLYGGCPENIYLAYLIVRLVVAIYYFHFHILIEQVLGSQHLIVHLRAPPAY